MSNYNQTSLALFNINKKKIFKFKISPYLIFYPISVNRIEHKFLTQPLTNMFMKTECFLFNNNKWKIRRAFYRKQSQLIQLLFTNWIKLSLSGPQNNIVNLSLIIFFRYTLLIFIFTTLNDTNSKQVLLETFTVTDICITLQQWWEPWERHRNNKG